MDLFEDFELVAKGELIALSKSMVVSAEDGLEAAFFFFFDGRSKGETPEKDQEKHTLR